MKTFTNFGNASVGRQPELMRSMAVDPGDKAEVAEQMAHPAERHSPVRWRDLSKGFRRNSKRWRGHKIITDNFTGHA